MIVGQARIEHDPAMTGSTRDGDDLKKFAGALNDLPVPVKQEMNDDLRMRMRLMSRKP